MNKAPKLRFKEFSGDWQEKRLGDLSNLTSSKRIFASDYVTKGIPFYRGKEITELKQGKQPTDILYITNEKYDEIRNKFGVPKKGELLLTAVGTLGNSYVIRSNNPFYFKDGNLIWFQDIKENPNYLDLIISSEKGKKKILDSAIGSTQKALTIVELNKLKYMFPEIEEQEKIASLFSLIDDKISLQGEKVEALKDYKTGMMQKIFSRELRFKDDDGREYPEWEDTKLGECIENKGGTALEKFVEENGTHKFISIGNYSTDGKYVDSGQRISLNDKSKDKLLYKNELVMVLNDKTATGDLIGSTILIDADNTYIYNQRSERLICKENIQPDFAWILLNYEGFRKNVFSIAQGGTQIYVNFSSVKDLKVELPSLKEQIKISKYILNLDAKLEREQNKLNYLNEYKKGLLQQMFV